MKANTSRILTISIFVLGIIILENCTAQEILVYKNSISIGQLSDSNKPINAKKYIFPQKIYDLYFGSDENVYYVQLRNQRTNSTSYKSTGKLIAFDYRKMEVKWVSKLAYKSEKHRFFNSAYIVFNGAYSRKIDLDNGSVIWEAPTNIAIESPRNDILMGYRINQLDKNNYTFQGVSESTGKKLWEREIVAEYGWNDLSYLNDTTMIIVSSGVHTINLKNGKGWDYYAETGKKKYAGAITQAALGIAFGVMTGFYYVVVPNEVDFIGDIVSNVLVEDDELFFASKDSIYKLDIRTGKKFWSSLLPEKIVSKSSIQLRDSLVYMMNLGYATRNQNPVNFGTPFFAAYNINSGKQEFLQVLEPKKSLILDYRIQANGKTLILQEDKMCVLSNQTGEVLSFTNHDKYKYGELDAFVSEDFYILNSDSIFTKIIESNESEIWISTMRKTIIGLNQALEIKSFYPQKDVYKKVFEYNEYLFLSNQTKTVVVDKSLKKIAEINLSENAFINGNSLFDFKDNGLLVVDLETAFIK